MSLTGKVAIVTGGSQGIGRAISILLAQRGASVVVNYSRSEGPAREVVDSINSPHSSSSSETNSPRAIAIKADAGSVLDVKRLVAETIEKFGRLDIVVANAAWMDIHKGLENTTEEDFDKAFNVNVKGPFFLVQEAAPHLPNNGGRVILFSSSTTKNTGVPYDYLVYTSTKGAIEQMTRCLAKDLGRRGITVNAVSPGATATQGFFEGKSEELIRRIAESHPMGELGKSEDVAEMVGFLASEEARWVNGQTVGVNGGLLV